MTTSDTNYVTEIRVSQRGRDREAVEEVGDGQNVRGLVVVVREDEDVSDTLLRWRHSGEDAELLSVVLLDHDGHVSACSVHDDTFR